MANDKFFSATKTLLHFEGSGSTFTDVKSKTYTGNGSVALSSAQSRYGSSSLLLDGTDDYIYTSTNVTDFNFGTSPYTVEASIKTSSNNGCIFDFYGTAGAYGWRLEVNINGNIVMTSGGGSVTVATVDVRDNNWHDIAVDKVGSTVYVYIDGDMKTSGECANTANSTATQLTIGAYANGTYRFNGYIDEVRVTKGVARYKGSDYTPAAFGDLQADIWGFNKSTRKISNPRTVMRASQIRHLGV